MKSCELNFNFRGKSWVITNNHYIVFSVHLLLQARGGTGPARGHRGRPRRPGGRHRSAALLPFCPAISGPIGQGSFSSTLPPQQNFMWFATKFVRNLIKSTLFNQINETNSLSFSKFYLSASPIIRAVVPGWKRKDHSRVVEWSFAKRYFTFSFD